MKKNSKQAYDEEVAPVPPSENSVNMDSPVLDIPTNSKKRLLLFIALIVIVLITVLAVIYYFQKIRPMPTSQNLSPTEIASQQIVAKVGDEYLYQKDLNYQINTFYPSSSTDSAMKQEATTKSLDKLINDSIILQEAQKNKLTIAPKEAYNNPNKNIFLRNQAIASATAKLSDQFVSRISGEEVSIWFNNGSYPPPKMGVDAAKKFALEKMQAIFADLKSGKITFAEAGNQIKNDKSLINVDRSYQTNAYSVFKDKAQNLPIFNDPNINNVIWTLRPGEISNILTANDFHNGDPSKPYEALFKVIKVTDKVTSAATDFPAWLKAERAKYEVTKY